MTQYNSLNVKLSNSQLNKLKSVKICDSFIIYIQSYPMNSNIRIFININYIWSIFYFTGKIISTIETNKSRFILIIGLYLKVCQWVGSQNFLDP